MRRARITITLDQNSLKDVDALINGNTVRNRSHAIESIVRKFFSSSVNQAVILAGGVGTKHRPYTYELPASLLPIGGKPALEHLIEHLRTQHITEIVICIGHLGNKIKNYFKDGKQWGVHITYSQENTPLMTGGALLNARKLIGNRPFLLIHGDVFTNFSFRELISFHEKEHALASVALTSVSNPEEYGQFRIHGTKLVRFLKFDSKVKKIDSHLIHAGIYVLDPEIFSFFPTSSHFLLEDIIIKLISGKRVHGFVFEGNWYDVGTPIGYKKAIEAFKTSRPEVEKYTKQALRSHKKQ